MRLGLARGESSPRAGQGYFSCLPLPPLVFSGADEGLRLHAQLN
jgi:hypothetical protein